MFRPKYAGKLVCCQKIGNDWHNCTERPEKHQLARRELASKFDADSHGCESANGGHFQRDTKHRVVLGTFEVFGIRQSRVAHELNDEYQNNEVLARPWRLLCGVINGTGVCIWTSAKVCAISVRNTSLNLNPERPVDMRTQTGTAIHLEDYRPSDYLIDEVALEFNLDPDETIVSSNLLVRRREGVEAGTPLKLHGDELELISLGIDGKDATNTCVFDDDGVEISEVPSGPKFTVTIVTRINPTANKKLMGLYRTSGNFCTQCEAEGFRRITYYLDRPDVLSVFTVRVEGDKGDAPLLLSNGNCIGSGELANNRHFAEWHDPHPKPAYLFALFAGDLGVVKDEFTTMSGRKVALEIFVEHGKEPRAAYAMDALIRSMKWDEEVYGCEYDLDIFMIVAVSDFNMGAMENKGLNIFNDKYVLADPNTATDQDYANIEAIIAHEYFHNWTGNRITCRDWFQLCLKEGLTVFRDHSFSADMRSAPVKRISEVRALRAHQFPEDSGPLAHPVRPRKYAEINNFYTSTVYEKGSELIGMLRTILGAKGFKAGMDLYFERHDGDASTIEDFIKCFEDATETNLAQFSLWYDQPGTPNLAISTKFASSSKRFIVKIVQSNKPVVEHAELPPLHIPVRFGLIGADGNDIAWTGVTGADVIGDVIHLRESEHTIVFEGIAEKPVLSALRGFSAPVTTVPERSDSELSFLARHDSDAFARWEALYSLLMRQLRKATTSAIAGRPVKVSPETFDILVKIATDETLEPAYRALCLTLPSEADVAREIGSDIDPNAVFAAREAVLNQIASSASGQFETLYKDHTVAGPYSPDAEAAGKRALQNVALGYICRAKSSPATARSHYDEADDMTNKSAALNVIAHQFPDSDETKFVLEDFRARFEFEPIVLDKWLAIQATIPGDRALERVVKLTQSPHFSWENPNRVRAVVGSFAAGNSTGFNRADGKGYEFLCEAMAKLDQINPQVAARLITAMRSWRTLEDERRAHALRALTNLAASENLSRDMRDIVERTLS